MTDDNRDECKDCGDSDCPWHLFDRFLADMKALVPEAGESNALCETCDGALNGCAVCVGGIKPDIIERVHKQGQRDMLAKVMRCHTCKHYVAPVGMEDYAMEDQCGECMIELGAGASIFLDASLGPVKPDVLVDALWGCRSWEVSDGE